MAIALDRALMFETLQPLLLAPSFHAIYPHSYPNITSSQRATTVPPPEAAEGAEGDEG
eukprot:CAMPEP_0179474506 /NCGR_PEP_ID=MMETSP0799-20121207/53929_1 /TAXON_ID=46947 /ORGANISM="Geminigera cryophila, Strain CCMP2564" /LENGTH=57 /DNA_ID=CAMNT_0021283571 /DNA_START=108 /DNA_END=277 /DNA_ORIENTATION=-